MGHGLTIPQCFNEITVHIRDLEASNAELLAALIGCEAYLRDDSRSPRRRMTNLVNVRAAIAQAKS